VLIVYSSKMSEEINEIIKFCSTKIPLFRNRDYVEALWSGIPSNKDQWFTGAVVSHRLLCTRGFKNTFVYDIEFIDGDFEYSIPEEKIRKCSHAVYAKEMKLLQLKIEGEKEINNKKMAAKRKRCSRGAGAKEEEESEMNVLERDQQREQEVLGPKKKKSKASILGAIDCTPTTKQHKSSCIPLFLTPPVPGATISTSGATTRTTAIGGYIDSEGRRRPRGPGERLCKIGTGSLVAMWADKDSDLPPPFFNQWLGPGVVLGESTEGRDGVCCSSTTRFRVRFELQDLELDDISLTSLRRWRRDDTPIYS